MVRGETAYLTSRHSWSWVPACAGTTLYLEHLPRLQRDEFFPRHFGLIERLAEREHRRVDRFIGELEGAVVMSQRLRRAAIGQRLHRVPRIHVLVLHEPARL